MRTLFQSWFFSLPLLFPLWTVGTLPPDGSDGYRFADQPLSPGGEFFSKLSPQLTRSLNAQTLNAQILNAQTLNAQTGAHAIVQLKRLDLAQPKVSGSAQIPLERLPNSRGVFTLPLTIGAQPATFLLDTGASTTLLTAELRQQLGLNGIPVNRDHLSYAVAGKDCPEMTATRLQTPQLALQGAQVVGLETLQFDQTLIPDGADGVLGMDVLGEFDLTIDPMQNQLFIEPPTPLTAAQRLQAIPLTIQSGVGISYIWINRQGPFKVLLDTAADSTFISKSVAQQLQLTDRQSIQMLGFCGLEAAERTQLTRITLGNNFQENLEAIITDSSVLSTLGIDGVLGQNFLNAYQQQWKSFGDKKWLILETAKSTKNENR